MLNTTEDGENLAYLDPTSGIAVWNLMLTNLTQAEVAQLEALYAGCFGRWASFTFLDPTDNLLSYSGNLTSSVWTVPPGVTVRTGTSDPQGGTGACAITNQSQVAAIFGQTLAAPPNFTYAFSVFVRAASPANFSLVRTGDTEQVLESASLSTQWTRVQSTEQLKKSGSSVTFGIQLQPGQQIQVYGMQCEAQPEPSEFYRPTYGIGGLYSNAYFAMEALTVSADSPGQYSTFVSIEAAR